MFTRSTIVGLCAVCIAAVLAFTVPLAAQQQLPTPQLSPKATVSQTVGITDVTIVYHRPGVKNRMVWGGIVPYDQVWRAGANENTTVAFTDPVTIEGKELAAGTYGLHMIPTHDTWTVIFSKNSTSWGSSYYDEKEDALRVTVKPQPAPMEEMLRYGFENVTDNSADVVLRWEKLMIPVKMEVDTKRIVLEYARNVYLRGLAGFTWQGLNQAATYCLQNDTNLDEALTWADKSIARNENVTNLYIKGSLLNKLGRSSEADPVTKRVMDIARSEGDVNLVGYLYLGSGKPKEAIQVFKKNVKSFPNSWNAYDSLGEGYAANGDTKLAIENYSKALGMVNDAAQKTRISAAIQRLQAGANQ